jgi:nucleotide-binding universal stress UspA family protein
MTCKTILLCLNETSRIKQLVAVGCELGAKFKAHVSGLYIIPGVQVLAAGGFSEIPVVNEENQKFFRSKQAAIMAEFEDAMKDDGIAFGFRLIESDLPSYPTEQINNGHSADLIVTSAPNPKGLIGTEIDSVERIVMGSGRPVLALPYAGDVKMNWNEALIGWNDSRESARAVFDAIPYLKQFKKVRIVTIDETLRGKVPGALLAEALDRHGMKVEVSTIMSEGMGVGEALQRAANDYGSSVIVMGAYGHSRMMEFIFGGVTRHMLRHIKTPTLFAH